MVSACISPNPCTRELTIRPLQRAPRLPTGFETATWAVLREVVCAVFEKRPLPGGSCEEVYRSVEAMCANGLDARLAANLLFESEKQIRTKFAVLSVPPSTANPDGLGDAALLQLTDSAWRDHCEAMQTICALFLHLDRTYVVAQRGRAATTSQHSARSLWDAGLQLFRAQLDAQPDVKDAVIFAMLRLVDSERRGASAPQPVLGSLVEMFSKLGAYDGAFEPAMLTRTAEFYREESAGMLTRTSVPEYLAYCERRLSEEVQRCESHFEQRTVPRLLAELRRELLEQHCAEVLEKGFGALVEGQHVADLERLYRLFADVDALPAVRKAWSQAIKHIGSDIMASGEDPEESKAIVPKLMEFRARLSDLLVKSFQGSSNFGLSLKDAFEEFLNAGVQNLPAKLLSRHIDEVLRNETSCSDAELEEGIDRVMGIFRCVAAKDAFEAFYKKDLAKRLLLQRSSSADAEALMVQKLREECGSGFTSKLEGMFRDVDISKGILTTFVGRPEAKAILEEGSIEFSVSVLTSGLWPTQPPSPDIAYPAAPARLQEAFSSFYATQHTGRSLRWSPALGQCTLRANYESGSRKELVVSHFQALVLLLFNTATSLTCSEIEAATRIPMADLHRTLQSLALHKYVKLILKEPKAREVNDGDVFTYNAGFSHKMYRIIVTSISPKEQQEEEMGVEQRVFEDRQHEVDAAVVRIMKVKKSLSHQQLLAEVFRTVSFPVKAADVKKRIESLIEREYLERDGERSSTYTYLA